MINTAKITDNDWLVYHEACRIAIRKRRVNRNCRDDCMSYLLTILPDIWKNYDAAKSCWNSFAVFCASRRINNWYHVENLEQKLAYRGPSRVISIDDDTVSRDEIVGRRNIDPLDILANSELLNILYGRLPDTQQREMIRWFLHGHVSTKHNEKVSRASLKHHDNMRNNIKIMAKRIFQESMPELFAHIKVQPRIKKACQKRSRHRIGVLGERMITNRFRLLLSMGCKN